MLLSIDDLAKIRDLVDAFKKEGRFDQHRRDAITKITHSVCFNFILILLILN